MDLKSIIQQYKPAFIEQYGDRVLPGQWQALNAMQRCRTPGSGELSVHCTGTAIKLNGCPCPVDTAVVPFVRIMKSVNGLTANRKNYCRLSILW